MMRQHLTSSKKCCILPRKMRTFTFHKALNLQQVNLLTANEADAVAEPHSFSPILSA